MEVTQQQLYTPRATAGLARRRERRAEVERRETDEAKKKASRRETSDETKRKASRRNSRDERLTRRRERQAEETAEQRD